MAKPLLGEAVVLDQCPFLHDSLVQFCGAASLTKYIPYSEAVLSHCGTDSHKYCELFLAFAHPDRSSVHGGEGAGHGSPEPLEREVQVDSVRVRTDLLYSPNHMWAEISEDNTVHIGIDALLAGVLGSVDEIAYVTPRGTHRPTVVFTVNGTELPLIFPLNMSISAVNAALRTHPSRLFADPYTSGWLFEGTDLERQPSKSNGAGAPALISGAKAVSWMRDELRHVADVVHELSHAADNQGVVLMADGGDPQPGVGQHLTRGELLHVFNEMFSPMAGWRNSQ